MGNKLNRLLTNGTENEIKKLLDTGYVVTRQHVKREIIRRINYPTKDVLELILKYYKNIKKDNKNLHTEVYRGNYNIIKLLLKYGIDPNMKDKYGRTALMITPIQNTNLIFDVLVEYGADINAVQVYKYETIYYNCELYNYLPVIGHAIVNRNYEYIAKLVDKKVNLLKLFYHYIPINNNHGVTRHKNITHSVLDITDDISKKLIIDLYNEQVNKKLIT
jgi:ankyrin repeat protein